MWPYDYEYPDPPVSDLFFEVPQLLRRKALKKRIKPRFFFCPQFALKT
jgi:hypothetical protein